MSFYTQFWCLLADIIIMSIIYLVLDLGIKNGGCVTIGEFSKIIYGAASKMSGIIFTEVYIRSIY